MRPSELDALIAQGPDAMRAALADGSLSTGEALIVVKALNKIEAAGEDASAEEPVASDAPDSTPKPKVEKHKVSRRSTPAGSGRKKG